MASSACTYACALRMGRRAWLAHGRAWRAARQQAAAVSSIARNLQQERACRAGRPDGRALRAQHRGGPRQRRGLCRAHRGRGRERRAGRAPGRHLRRRQAERHPAGGRRDARGERLACRTPATRALIVMSQPQSFVKWEPCVERPTMASRRGGHDPHWCAGRTTGAEEVCGLCRTGHSAWEVQRGGANAHTE
jgi:hypothetical protein